MDHTKKYNLKDDVVYRLLDGMANILDVNSGESFDLNETGTEVFLSILEGKTPVDIMKYQLEKYDIDEDTVKSDIEECVKTLLDKGIVKEDMREVRSQKRNSNKSG